ncbi:transcription-repair coupling factor (superfamily II helicase) [Bacillus fengqiuensis]|nr:transcription-repair coupling factor (superfamily II helicase) [Bacillus fengqiuensis]
MLGIKKYFYGTEDIQAVVGSLEEGLSEQMVAGLSGSSRSILAASLYEKKQHPLLIVTHNLYQAQKFYEDLINLLPEEPIFLYSSNDLIASEIATASPELRAQRIEVLNYWSRQSKGIIVTPISGLRKLLPSKALWQESQLAFKAGEEIELEEQLTKLVTLGYERVGMVSSPGEFSIRGGIIDIYPLTEELPVRIELFDTEIDSIRTFTIEDQRSQKKMNEITIGPAVEMVFADGDLQRGISSLEKGLAATIKKVKDPIVKEKILEQVGQELEQLKQGSIPEHVFKYVSLFYEKPTSLLDYVPDHTVVMFDETTRIHEMSDQLDKEEADWITDLLAAGEVIHGVSLSQKLSHLIGKTTKRRIYLSLFLKHIPFANPQNIINISCKSMQQFYGQMNLLKSEVDRWLKSNMAVVLLGANQERVEKLERVLADYEISASVLSSDSDIVQGKVQIMQGDLQAGFELPMQKLAILTEEELFKKRAKKTQRRQKLSNAERIKSYSELNVGDHVVHINHGIGRYLGIETLEINGIHKDYIHIKYEGSDKLYVPVEQIDQVQKYVGSEGKEPKLYKLGGNEWKKVKKKVESSVQDIADDLIKLYAEREASKGYAFSPDGDMQRSFETSFPYQETEDQLRSIQEIKRDMERERPMDRLLCGDVGYGKTEVAIRAAFKAISDGKQVAFLVPTTILAQQHYETIRERFQDYPVNIGLLSRFRTRKQLQETTKGLKNGTVDIVVGTHRLLSKDVTYKDLGLLIIDEEQRFGVTHKEKIKQMKTNVDVLTLTATPIPRTLHMSMLGVRDLSVIETPPENRFPVQTYVAEYNPGLVREAIERELAREGQVYFLYNRVEDIERKAEEISMLVPDARVAFAHGKMNENELEAVILSFLEGEYDVLVSTTIIETGVDIPNVNTLIVHDADKMGLSQLYQLRGRVGRSSRVAYAYFTYRKDKVLTEVAEKRLQAIKEFTELGSGFKIAMRDLSIRGAGNLLGSQQHGFIDSVGFDLYSQMLKEAIEARKEDGEEKKEVLEVEVNVDIDAYIPDQYIADGRLKIEMYKRFRAIETLEDVQELQEEMIDRFGDYPEEVAYLFKIAEMKVYAKMYLVESIMQAKQNVTILLSEEASETIDGAKLFKAGNEFGRMISLGMEGKKVKMVINTKGLVQEKWLDIAYQMIKDLPNVQREGVKS